MVGGRSYPIQVCDTEFITVSIVTLMIWRLGLVPGGYPLLLRSDTAVSNSLNKMTNLYTRMGGRGLCHKSRSLGKMSGWGNLFPWTSVFTLYLGKEASQQKISARDRNARVIWKQPATDLYCAVSSYFGVSQHLTMIQGAICAMWEGICHTNCRWCTDRRSQQAFLT